MNEDQQHQAHLKDLLLEGLHSGPATPMTPADWDTIRANVQQILAKPSNPHHEELDSDDTPTEVVLEGICQGLYEALTDQTIPLTQMWQQVEEE